MRIERILVVAGAVLVLGAVNFSIMGKEAIKREGQVVFLDLAPRDPRSLMQGDYMTLRFALAAEIRARLGGKADREGDQGMADVMVDDKGGARLAPPGTPGTLRIRYRIRRGDVWLGTNAFFFEESSEGRFSTARYGEFRVDRRSGEAVLVGLRDARLAPL